MMNRDWPESIKIFDCPARGIFSERITKIDYGEYSIDIIWPSDLIISWRDDYTGDIRSVIDRRIEYVGRRINMVETRRFTLFGVAIEVGPAIGYGTLYPKLKARGHIYDSIGDCIDRFKWPPDSDRLFDGRHPDSLFAPIPEVIGRPDNYDAFVSECERREVFISSMTPVSCSTKINGHTVIIDDKTTITIDGDVKELYIDGCFNPAISEVLVGYRPVDGNEGILDQEEGIFETIECVPIKFVAPIKLEDLVIPARLMSLIEKRTYEFLFWYGGGTA